MGFRKTMTQEAKEEGIRLGIERGIEKGQRELLLRLCQKKFRQYPGEFFRNRIESMSIQEIEDFEEQLLNAQSISELGFVE